MSQVLSYNNKTTKTAAGDWIAVAPYVDDDIRRIHDPNGGLSVNPRTAIPSPFAGLDLVKNAFERLAGNPRLDGTLMDKRLVSNALDVAQLFFDYENHKDYLHIVRWNRDEQIERLKSSAEHRLYGETLELFLNSDSKYNFDRLTDWYILLWNSQVIGATSPSSFTIAVPRERELPINAIKVEQGVTLFDVRTRDLWERDEGFVYYMFVLFNAYPSLRRSVKGVYDYMLRNKDLLQRERPSLYGRIAEAVPNLEALNEELAPRLVERLELDYDAFAGDNEVSVLGARLYHKRVRDIRRSASESDFVLSPTRPVAEGEITPLVLRNNFNGSVDNFIYIDKQWDSSTQVLTGGLPVEKRKLPDTSIVYPFVTTGDFLSPQLVRLSAPLDGDHYFDGNVKNKTAVNPAAGYLLPLTPLFFKYFNAADVTGDVQGRPMFELEELSDGSVTATLRIPLKKRHIELTRNYYPIDDEGWQYDERRGTGRLVTGVVMSAALFPFVRTGRNDDYTMQLFAMSPASGARLRFLRDGMSGDGIVVNSKERTATGTYSTTYYDINGSFDLVETSLESGAGTLTGYIIPLWKPYVASSKELIFAVDFGTTNSHIEWAERDRDSEPLTFRHSPMSTLVAPLLKSDTLLIAEQLQRIEFLPADIDDVYGFPLRSALASNVTNAGGTSLFGDLNIPFLYERQYFDGYDVTTNLKWRGDTTLSREFLRELVLLIKAKVLLENADPSRVTIVYFYPVSMGGSDRRRLSDAWTELYRTYMGSNTENVQCYPESIAPAFFYRGADVSGSSYVSIDIGGGTSDVVVYQPTSDRLDSRPVAISSFRFAGDALFGDAFAERDADNNPLIAHYGEYFKRLIDNNPDIAYLNSILADVRKNKRSQDINAMLFSIENVEQLRTLREVDRNLYSYNALLRNDQQRKLVFMYFYSAIIYYIARSMKARSLEMPKQVYYSGTGSKILNIVGSIEQVRELTQMIFERVYNQKYATRFDIKIEQECPKQITCRGGIRLENARRDGTLDTDYLSARSINAMKYCYSMIGDEALTMQSVNSLDTRERLVAAVKEFDSFFVGLCDNVMRDEMGIDNKVFKLFMEVLEDDIDNYMTAGLTSYLKGRYEPEEVVEDVPFFYPIIGIIRHNLLRNLCNEVIQKL
ncbi:MAG: hypothetical protein IJ835_01520 [Muribaculaceae bacterium]|nr:hypothetical protein [Muribaculaceae bacterium]